MTKTQDSALVTSTSSNLGGQFRALGQTCIQRFHCTGECPSIPLAFDVGWAGVYVVPSKWQTGLSWNQWSGQDSNWRPLAQSVLHLASICSDGEGIYPHQWLLSCCEYVAFKCHPGFSSYLSLCFLKQNPFWLVSEIIL